MSVEPVVEERAAVPTTQIHPRFPDVILADVEAYRLRNAQPSTNAVLVQAAILGLRYMTMCEDPAQMFKVLQEVKFRDER
jgi:hypothetical protein